MLKEWMMPLARRMLTEEGYAMAVRITVQLVQPLLRWPILDALAVGSGMGMPKCSKGKSLCNQFKGESIRLGRRPSRGCGLAMLGRKFVGLVLGLGPCMGLRGPGLWSAWPRGTHISPSR